MFDGISMQDLLMNVCRLAPIGVAFLNLDGSFVKVNPALCGMLGYEEEELEGFSFHDFANPEDLPVTISHQEQLRTGQIHSFQLEVRYISKSKNTIWTLLTGCLLHDYQGQPLCYVFQMIDFTERKRMEMRLKEIEQRHKSLIKYTPAGICVLDQQGNIVDANPACEAIAGFSIGELTRKNFRELVTEEDTSWAESLFFNAFQQDVRDAQIPIIHKNGNRIDLLAASSPIIVNGETVGIYVIVKDISEVKHTEELLRRSEKLSVVGELAAGIAHEIRNPLMSLRGFIQLLSRDDLDPRHNNYYSIMLSEVDRINLIVTELLLLAKPEKRKFEFKDIVNKLQHVVALLQAEANLRNVQIHTRINQKIPLVFCEGIKIKQVLVNILKNAIEAMPEAGEIHIEAESDRDYVYIRITDQGHGIPNEVISLIGQPFYTTKESGTGLGLTVCYRIIENHQGNLRITSEMGKGTTVEISLPTNLHQTVEIKMRGQGIS